jgi:hypothetical protein
LERHYKDPLIVEFSAVEVEKHLTVPVTFDDYNGAGELGKCLPAKAKLEAELASTGDDLGIVHRR